MGDLDSKSIPRDNLEQWKEIVGGDANRLWAALDEEIPPPFCGRIEREHTAVNSWRTTTAAAVMLCILLVGINMQQRRRLTALMVDNAIQKLSSAEIQTRFAGVEQLQGMRGRLSDSAVRELFALLTSSHDPNVQLDILEILIVQKRIRSAEDIPLGNGPAAVKSQFLTVLYEELYQKESHQHDSL